MTQKKNDQTTPPMTLADRMLQAPHSPQRAARLDRAAFLAISDQIQDAIQRGIPLKRIHAHLVQENTLQISYRTFGRYCTEAGLKRRSGHCRRCEPNSGTRSIASLAPLEMQ